MVGVGVGIGERVVIVVVGGGIMVVCENAGCGVITTSVCFCEFELDFGRKRKAAETLPIRSRSMIIPVIKIGSLSFRLGVSGVGGTADGACFGVRF